MSAYSSLVCVNVGYPLRWEQDLDIPWEIVVMIVCFFFVLRFHDFLFCFFSIVKYRSSSCILYLISTHHVIFARNNRIVQIQESSA